MIKHADIVIVGSQNPVKIEGTRKGFEKMFPNHLFIFQGFNAVSGVNVQPTGSEETLTGAFNRANECRIQHPMADFFCGLESGIVTDPWGDLGVTTWAVIIDKDNNVGKGLSSFYALSPKVSDLVKQGVELGTANDLIFEQSNSKQSHGAVGLLTDGACTRTDTKVEAVTNALIPHKNQCHYFQS